MKNPIEMTGNTCQITSNGDVYIRPSSRNFIFLLIIIAGALAVGLWLRVLVPASLALVFVSAIVLLLTWANQQKTQFSQASSTITRRRWFHRHHNSFGDVLEVSVCLERIEYAWSAHLVNFKNVVEVQAILELVLKDHRRLYLGRIAGKRATEQASELAQTLSDLMSVPVSHFGYDPRN